MRIHILSASLKTNSGFSQVARYLAQGLKKLNHEVTISGLQTIYQPEYSFGFEILPTQVLYINDVTQFILNLQRTNPDVVICIHQADSDFNDFPIESINRGYKTYFYTVVEGKSIPAKMENDLKYFINKGGKIIVPAVYGQNELKKKEIESKYICYGYDDSIFKPINMNNKNELSYCYLNTEIGRDCSNPKILCKYDCYNCKKQQNTVSQIQCDRFNEEIVTILRTTNFDGKKQWQEKEIKVTDLPNEVRGKLVFQFIGHNLGVRKRIERLLSAYSILINGDNNDNHRQQNRQIKDRTVLWLHTRPIAQDGVNLLKIVHDLSLEDNVIFSHGRYGSSGWSDQSMNILYNIADVQTTASSTEGLCLPALHSMSVGVPIIAPNCSAFTELIGEDNLSFKEVKDTKNTNRGILANIESWQMTQNEDFRALVNESDLASKMKELYTNEKERNRLGDNALKFSKTLTWNVCVDKWNKLLYINSDECA